MLSLIARLLLYRPIVYSELSPFVPPPAGYRVWWMQDYLFRDPVVTVRCQAYTGAAAATARDKGECGVSWGEEQ